MDQLYYHLASLLRSMELDMMYEELQKMRLPFQVHYTDGSLSWFLRPDKTADAVLWQNHLLGLRDKTCNWDEAQRYCQEYTIGGKPCRMMTSKELQLFNKQEVLELDKLLQQLGGTPLSGELWSSDTHQGVRGELACIKDIGSEHIPQWTYKNYARFYKARPIL